MRPPATCKRSIGALVVVVLLLAGCSPGDEEQEAPSITAASVSPSPTPSEEPEPIAPVAAREVLRAKGYRFLRATGGVRVKAQSAFRKVVGPDLYEVATRRAQRESDLKERKRALERWRKIKRKFPKRDRPRPGPVPEALIIVLSVKADEGSVDELHTVLTEALTQGSATKELSLSGKTAHFSKDATPRHQSRVFFFEKRTVLVQVFGGAGFIKELAARMLER